jgi:mannose-6-phosphate isomerase-like protein (cupin superfamily)
MATSQFAPQSSTPADEEWSEVTPGERALFRIRARDTDGAYITLEVVADPLNGVPIHTHNHEIEHFIILEGTAHVICGGRRWDAAAGTSFTVDKGVPHGWCNRTAAPLRRLVTFSPGHIESLFRAAVARGPDDDVAALAQRHGTVLVGPPLFKDTYWTGAPRPERQSS